MNDPFPYFDAIVKSEPPLLQRILRVLQIVASFWTVLGAGINFFALDHAALKWHIFGFGCLLVAAAMYSILIPLYYIARAPKADANA